MLSLMIIPYNSSALRVCPESVRIHEGHETDLAAPILRLLKQKIHQGKVREGEGPAGVRLSVRLRE